MTATAAWDSLLGVRTERDAQRAGLVRRADGSWRWRADDSPEANRLADLYAPLCLAGPRFAFAQLGQSLDGGIATRTGDSIFVTGEADREHLHRLRALADAVVVGVDTDGKDDPRLTVRACAGRHPVRVVLDHSGRANLDRRVFTDSAAPTLWVVGCTGDEPTAPDGVELVRLACADGTFTPASVLDMLAGRGLGRVLVEGGGVTVSRFLAAGALGRLYLTVAPVIIGDGVPGLRFPGATRMGDALRAPVRRFPLGDDTLFELDLLAPLEGTHDQDDRAGQAAGEGEHAVQHGDRQSLAGTQTGHLEGQH
jgi:riboflavin-specific deaminase-like protein